MSTPTQIARPYADALANAAEAAGTLVEVRAELQAFTDTVAGSRELHELFASPAISPDKKKLVLDEILKVMAPSDLVANTLRLMLANTRMHHIAFVNKAYSAEVDRRMGVVKASVTSASELSPEEQSSLTGKLETLTGKQVKAEFTTDADLIGGVVTRIGSRIYDGSVRAKLDAYRRRMTGQVRA